MMNSAKVTRIPPQAIDVEEAIFATLFAGFCDDPDDILDALTEKDFYKTAHQKIFNACKEVKKRGDDIKSVMVAGYMRDAGILEECGGSAMLSSFLDLPPLTKIAGAIKKLQDCRVLREIITASQKNAMAAYDAGLVDKEEILDEAQKRILKIDFNTIRLKARPISEIVEEAADRYESVANGKQELGILSGFKQLDYLTNGFMNGEFTILAGRPSMGKSAMMLSMALNMARDGVKVGMFSLEMPENEIADRLVSMSSKVDLTHFRSGFHGEDWRKVCNGMSNIHNYEIIVEDTTGLTILKIKRLARLIKKKFDVDIFFVDHLKKMRGVGSSSYERMSELSQGLFEMTRELHLPVIALSQLSRALEQRADKRPLNADLRDSGTLEEDANKIIFLHRESAYTKMTKNYDSKVDPDFGRAEAIVSKNRNGPTGTAFLGFKEENALFYNLENRAPF
jgi:replicative DNA helicase